MVKNNKKMILFVFVIAFAILGLMVLQGCDAFGQKREIVAYTITYENTYELDNDNPTKYTAGTKTIVLNNLADREFYTFDGWYTAEVNGTKILEIPKGSFDNIKLYAVWKAVEFNINYENINDAINNNPASYTIEDTIVFSNASKDGYDFIGWFVNESDGNEITAITEGSNGDITLYARWEIITYTISYENTYEIDNDNITEYDIATQAFELSNLTGRVGYDFVGWYDESGNKVTKISENSFGNITLYARWELIKYTITYIDEEDGVNNNPTSYTIEDTIVFSNASKDGYDFIGWFDNESDGNEITAVTEGSNGDITLFARWEIITYTISYENTYELDNDNIAEYDIEAPTFKLNNLAGRVGYDFVGWYDESGNKVTKISENSFGNITLFARWELIKYTITYIDEEDGVNNNPTSYTIKDTIVFSNASKDGYNFIGWFDSESDGSKITAITEGSNGDITLFARWEAVEEIINLEMLWAKNSGMFHEILRYELDEVFGYGYEVTIIDISLVINSIEYQTKWLSSESAVEFPSEEALYAFLASEPFYSDMFVRLPNTNILVSNEFGIPYILIGDVQKENNAYFNSSMEVLIRYSGTDTNYTIPDSVTTIDNGAFAGCESLTNIIIPDSVTTIGFSAFEGCTNLTNIVLGNNVETIKNSAFAGCESLTSIIVPDSVTTIGFSAFEDCSSLASINLPFVGNTLNGSSNTHFGYIFGASSYVPSSLKTIVITQATSIDSFAFSGCSSLTSITISDSVTSIGPSAFRDCSNLTSITLPFVGNTLNGSSNTHFGYIFGAGSHSSNASYVPSTLKAVIITDATSIRNNAFYNCGSLTSITISDNVTSIGEYAFYNCSSLTSVTIGDHVANIGEYAFNGCSSLTSINVTSGNATYASVFGVLFNNDGSELIKYPAGKIETAYTIPDGVTSIESHAFEDCSSLTSITIPDSVISIGRFAFNNCNSLTNIIIPDSVTSMESYAFYRCSNLTSITISEGLTNIEYYAFSLCSSLTSIVIPDSITSIGSTAFYGCSSLTSIVIPDSITSIGSTAFYGCDSLSAVYITDIASWVAIDFYDYASNPLYFAKNLYLNNELVTDLATPISVTSIESYAFYGCSSLTSITIPDSVTSIGERAFNDCRSLTSINVTSGNATYVSVIGVLFNNDGSELIQYPAGKIETAYTIPYGVTNIGGSAFGGCNSLTSITIPNSVARIGDYAFESCSSLTSITIPDSVTSIGYDAFSNCSSLTSITIPDSVTSIGDYAFSGCRSLTIYAEATSKPSGWDSNWNYSGWDSNWNYNDRPVYWNVSPSDVKVFQGLQYLIINGEITITRYIGDASSIAIPSSIDSISVTGIGDYVFSSCSSLTSITIPNSVTSIGSSALRGCSSLTSITLPFVGNTLNGTSDTHFGYIFGASPYTFQSSDIPTSLKTVIITKATSIAIYAFYDCSNLTSITIPDSVTSIGKYAFYNCSSLTSITIPNSVTSIGERAFYGCYNLESITLPFVGNTFNGLSNTHFGYIFGATSYVPSSLKTVEITRATSIASYAFSLCSSLTSIVISDSVTSIGERAFYGCSAEINWCDNSTIIAIGDYAFSGYKGTSVVIPDSVTTIGVSAFEDCNSLTSITLPFVGNTLNGTSDTHFGYIFGASSYSYNSRYVPSSLKTVEITKATSIASSAFYGCSSLISIAIPDSVNSIGDGAFGGCYSLTIYAEAPSKPNGWNNSWNSSRPVYWSASPNDVKEYPGEYPELQYLIINGEITITRYIGDASSIVIPSSIDSRSIISIGNSVFYNCSSLTSITIPDSVTSIGENAFNGCSAEIVWRDNPTITAIGDYAFSGYKGTSVVIPDSVTTIGVSAFEDCNSLTSITLPFVGNTLNGTNDTHFGYIFGASYNYYNSNHVPSSLKTVVITQATLVDDRAFYNCSSLTSITIPDSVTCIGERAFNGCSNLISIVIPDGVTSIEDGAFSSCSSLTSIVIPDSVTTIGLDAFNGCSNLTSIVIPDGVTSIEDGAFSSCSSLTSIVIPDSVTSIGDSAFYRCNSLTSIVIPNSVTSIGTFAFYNCISLTIYAEAITKPSSWDSDWNYSNRPVIWGCVLSETSSYVVSFTKTATSILNPNANNGIFAPYRDGYTFIGWATSSGSSAVAYTSANIASAPDGTTLYAIWQ